MTIRAGGRRSSVRKGSSKRNCSRWKVFFDRPDRPGVSWHSLVYGPADNGRLVMGGEMLAADMVILLMEMGSELDAVGAPVVL